MNGIEMEQNTSAAPKTESSPTAPVADEVCAKPARDIGEQPVAPEDSRAITTK
jgi:hypothetical protein